MNNNTELNIHNTNNTNNTNNNNNGNNNQNIEQDNSILSLCKKYTPFLFDNPNEELIYYDDKPAYKDVDRVIRRIIYHNYTFEKNKLSKELVELLESYELDNFKIYNFNGVSNLSILLSIKDDERITEKLLLELFNYIYSIPYLRKYMLMPDDEDISILSSVLAFTKHYRLARRIMETQFSYCDVINKYGNTILNIWGLDDMNNDLRLDLILYEILDKGVIKIWKEKRLLFSLIEKNRLYVLEKITRSISDENLPEMLEKLEIEEEGIDENILTFAAKKKCWVFLDNLIDRIISIGRSDLFRITDKSNDPLIGFLILFGQESLMTKVLNTGNSNIEVLEGIKSPIVYCLSMAYDEKNKEKFIFRTHFVNIALKIIQSGNALNYVSDMGDTPFMIAIDSKCDSCVSAFIKQSNLNKDIGLSYISTIGETALSVAINNDYTDVVLLILEKAKNDEEIKKIIHNTNKIGMGMIYGCILKLQEKKKKYIDVIKKSLLDIDNYDLNNYCKNSYNTTPLIELAKVECCSCGSDECDIKITYEEIHELFMIMYNRNEIDIHKIDGFGKNILFYLEQRNHYDILFDIISQFELNETYHDDESNENNIYKNLKDKYDALIKSISKIKLKNITEESDLESSIRMRDMMDSVKIKKILEILDSKILENSNKIFEEILEEENRYKMSKTNTNKSNKSPKNKKNKSLTNNSNNSNNNCKFDEEQLEKKKKKDEENRLESERKQQKVLKETEDRLKKQEEEKIRQQKEYEKKRLEKIEKDRLKKEQKRSLKLEKKREEEELRLMSLEDLDQKNLIIDEKIEMSTNHLLNDILDNIIDDISLNKPILEKFILKYNDKDISYEIEYTEISDLERKSIGFHKSFNDFKIYRTLDPRFEEYFCIDQPLSSFVFSNEYLLGLKLKERSEYIY